MRFMSEMVITLDRTMYTIESVPSLSERLITWLTILSVIWATLIFALCPVMRSKIVLKALLKKAVALSESLSEMVLGMMSKMLLPDLLAA